MGDMGMITIDVEYAFMEWWNKSLIRKDDDSLKVIAIWAWDACKKHYNIDEKNSYKELFDI